MSHPGAVAHLAPSALNTLPPWPVATTPAQLLSSLIHPSSPPGSIFCLPLGSSDQSPSPGISSCMDLSGNYHMLLCLIVNMANSIHPCSHNTQHTMSLIVAIHKKIGTQSPLLSNTKQCEEYIVTNFILKTIILQHSGERRLGHFSCCLSPSLLVSWQVTRYGLLSAW